jgi:hypothetical protein
MALELVDRKDESATVLWGNSHYCLAISFPLSQLIERANNSDTKHCCDLLMIMCEENVCMGAFQVVFDALAKRYGMSCRSSNDDVFFKLKSIQPVRK